LVSVLIPCYNQKKYLSSCIQSVIGQSYQDLEILISDDFSKDGSFELIENYRAQDDRIINLSQTEENVGLVQNFNKLFEAAKGDFIVFFSGDDIMDYNKIEIQINLLMQNPDVGLVHHDAKIINESGELIHTEIKSNLPILSALDYTFDIDWFHLKRFKTFLPTTVCARREYFLYARYNSSFERKHEILFYFENFVHLPNSKWMFIDAKLINYRNHNQNFTNTITDNDLIRKEREKLLDFIQSNYPRFIKKTFNARMFHLNEIYLFGYEYLEQYKVNFNKLKLIKPQFFMLIYLSKFLMTLGVYWKFSRLTHVFLVKPIYFFKNRRLIIFLQDV
jgi:glycosyltransferase involved in cell wall biosynthesis